MAEKRIASYLRTYRKKSGFTQKEIANLIGHKDSGRVSRHERGITLPPLLVAVKYETLFHVPISELFPSIYEIAVKAINIELAELESVLGQKSSKDSDANATACKLQFIRTRKPGQKI